MIAYGPVPSRRLGRSLGINNIPPKICTYSCVYCQLGRTRRLEAEPRSFYDPEKVRDAVADKLESAGRVGETVDYLTFVPDGEPTLDIRLGEEIDLLRSATNKKIAVITNGSLIRLDGIRENLKKADWVSVKIDSVQEASWRKINRPHRSFRLDEILDGIVAFAETYRGKLVTETMLVRGLNDDEDSLRSLSRFVRRLTGTTCYVSVPIRPPAEKRVQVPTEAALLRAYQILCEDVEDVEFLIEYEGNVFAFTGSVEKDLLGITAVHPMREEAVRDLLGKAGTDWSLVDRLIDKGVLIQKQYHGTSFYIRSLSGYRKTDMPPDGSAI
ncbi:MAG TPA: radical SAM protein [bacterium]|nr:radical SAM protein [bacterium]